MKNTFKIILFFLALSSCVEELDVNFGGENELPNILIVEATITDELKFHEIRLSKVDSLTDLGVDRVINPFEIGVPADSLDLDLVPHEENAQVRILVSDGSEISFIEGAPGSYISVQQFQAQEGLTYELVVNTADNRSFNSNAMSIEGTSTIADIYAEKVQLSDGGEGIEILIDNNPINGATGNLRFSYEETYKIIAPNWNANEFVLTNYDPCALPEVTYDLEIQPRTEEARVCFGKVSSPNVILNDNNLNDNGSLNRFSIQVLGQNNFKISHRYSIEVNQFVTSAESYGFYEKLNNFSQNGSVFSQIQPGFLEGNITSNDGRQGSVIGFFDVVSVSKKRLFFNFTDFFPDAPLPDYPLNCVESSSPESHTSYCFSGLDMNDCPTSIIERVNINNITYTGENSENLGLCPGPHAYVPIVCGDCRILGSNIVPEFWTEE